MENKDDSVTIASATVYYDIFEDDQPSKRSVVRQSVED